jgi:hypothetical protein
MQTNSYKIAALRREITAQIVALMKENNLKELELNTEPDVPEGQCDPIDVLWADNDGDWYESPVQKVILAGDSIELYCDNEHGCVTIESYEFACNHLGWLEEIRQGIIITLGLSDEPAVKPHQALLVRQAQLNNDMLSAITELLHTHGEQGRIVFHPEELGDGEDIIEYGGDFPITATLWGNHRNPDIDITEVFLSEDGSAIMARGIDQDAGKMSDEDFTIYSAHYDDVLSFILTVLKQQGVEL